MKITLIGYGKMGHAIERIALERGHRPDKDEKDAILERIAVGIELGTI